MPAFENSLWSMPTATDPIFAATTSSATTRPKTKTPLIAGSVCGGVMGIAWIIGFSIYFIKRYKRRKLNKKIAAGKAPPRKKDLTVPDEKIIIPPDPAILLGHRLPGEAAHIDERMDVEHVANDSTHYLQPQEEIRPFQPFVPPTNDAPSTSRLAHELVVPPAA